MVISDGLCQALSKMVSCLSLKITAYFLVLVVSIFSSAPYAFANEAEVFTYRDQSLLNSGGVNLSSRTDFFIDKKNEYDFEKIKNTHKEWKEVQHDVLDFNYETAPVWLCIRLSFGEINTDDWYLHLGSALYRNIEVYFISNGELIKEYQLQDIKKFSDKPYNHPYFIFPFNASSGDEIKVFLRIHEAAKITMPIYLEDSISLNKKSQNSSLIFGAFLGLMLALIVYNFFLYVSSRDIAYLYYVAYSFFVGIYFISLSGIGFQIFWPNYPNVDNFLALFPVSFFLIFSCLFVVEFLELKKTDYYLNFYFYSLAVLGVVFSFPLLFEEFDFSQHLYQGLFFICIFSFISVGVYGLHNKKYYSLYYVLAWVVFCMMNSVAFAASYIFFVYEHLAEFSFQISAAVVAVLLSLGLGSRDNYLREKNFNIHADNEEKSSFLAKMSHEIRTPMTGILGMSELLAERLNNPTNKHYNNVIFQSGQALLAIVNDVLDYSKIEAGNMEIKISRFNLEELVLETITIFKARALEKSLELIADIDENIPAVVEGDEQRIKQVMKNILNNAVKFTPEGQIILKVLLVDRPSSLIKISIIDSGEGIDEAYQQVLFDAFSQENNISHTVSPRNGGVGLGLAICKQLVEMMGGTIGFSSRKGLGSTFWFKLALKPCEAQFLNDRAYSQRELEGLRILIVDDNYTFCELLKLQVESWGMEAYLAHNGEQALKMLLQSEKANMTFDLVSIDLYMPVLDGLELGLQMQEHLSLRDVPRVLLTSIANSPTRSQLLDSGVTVSIEKPSSVNGLYDAFVSALNPEFYEPSTKDESSSGKSESLRILLVEDDEVSQIVIRSILQRMGHSVEVLSNGQEVLEKVQADDRSFDMILMDCEMPIMDGYEATRRIREWESRQQMLPIVIIALTAHSLDDQQEAYLGAGMDNYIEKPLGAKQLKEIIASYMF